MNSAGGLKTSLLNSQRTSMDYSCRALFLDYSSFMYRISILEFEIGPISTLQSPSGFMNSCQKLADYHMATSATAAMNTEPRNIPV